MASSLEKFLAIDIIPEIVETHNVVVKDGTKLDVDIKNIDFELFKMCKKRATEGYDTMSGKSATQLEEFSFCQLLCAYGICAPNLNNQQLRDKFNAHTNEALVAKIFPPATILQLGNRITRLTLGTQDKVEISDGTDPKLVEEAKN